MNNVNQNDQAQNKITVNPKDLYLDLQWPTQFYTSLGIFCHDVELGYKNPTLLIYRRDHNCKASNRKSKLYLLFLRALTARIIKYIERTLKNSKKKCHRSKN